MLFMYTLLIFTKMVDFYTKVCYDVKVYKQ